MKTVTKTKRELVIAPPHSIFPSSFLPQLATLVRNLPEGEKWISEIKWDGYRLIAFLDSGSVRLTTRRGYDWTSRFPSIALQLAKLPVENAILDGEVVVQNPDGTADFQKLQNSLDRRRTGCYVYYVFDLPYFRNRDLAHVPLIERKSLLHDLILGSQKDIPSVRYNDHLKESGERVLRSACGFRVEGIVEKRIDSPYLQKRTMNWVKKKCVRRQEFVVGGFTRDKEELSFFGSLVLGYYDDQGRLIHCGHVGTGFNARSIAAIYDRLKKLQQDQSPFATRVEDFPRSHFGGPRNLEYHWVRPELVVEVEFSELSNGSLRHASFKGIRDDKRPEEIVIERAFSPAEVRSKN